MDENIALSLESACILRRNLANYFADGTREARERPLQSAGNQQQQRETELRERRETGEKKRETASIQAATLVW